MTRMAVSRREALSLLAAAPLAAVASSCTPVDAQREQRRPEERSAAPRARARAVPPAAPSGVPWGGLDVIERGDAQANAAFVLLHGFGAPGDDLVSLADELVRACPRAMRVIVPAAPIAMNGGGRCWYEIHAEDAMPQAARARAQIEGVVRTLGERGVPSERVVLGGFSQGAILSIEVAVAANVRLAGIAVLSGRSLPHPARAYDALHDLAIFQSHGRSDPRIAYARGEQFRHLAEDAGARVEHVPFDGGHAIPAEVVTPLAAWLGRTPA